MPTATQRTLQASIARQRAKLVAVEAKLGELRAARARGDGDAAAMRDDEARLVAGRDTLRMKIEADREALLRESARVGDAIGADALDRRLPLALLPVRLETRYLDDALLVRIYPDEIHTDAHDPGVSDVERAAWMRFRKVVETSFDIPPMRDAWLQLARDVGSVRGLWLAAQRSLDGVPSRPPGYARAPRAALLPERFVAHAWLDDGHGTTLRAEAEKPVREMLALGPDPAQAGAAGDGSLDADSLWMVDFAAAEAAGMALRVKLPDTRARVSRLVVLGVRASDDSATTADAWDAHLRGQHATGGLSLPPPGSATNALPGERTRFSLQPDPATLYERALAFAVRSPLDPAEDPRPRRPPHYLTTVFDPVLRRDVERYDRFAPAVTLAEALGLSPTAFGWLDGAADDTLQTERTLSNVLRTAFESGLQAAFGKALPMPVAFGLDLLANGSALGPLPTLMVRSQPYGVLPLALGRDRDANEDWNALWAGAAALRETIFASAVEKTPRIAGDIPPDPVERMIEVLQAEGVAVAADLRLLLSDALAAHVFASADASLRTRLEGRREAARGLYAQLGGDPAAQPPLTERVLMAEAGAALPLVAPAEPGPGERPSEYLRRLADTVSPNALLANVLADPTPRALLFHVARIALLEAAADDTRRILLAEGLASEADFEPGGRLHRLADRLAMPAPARYVMPGQNASFDDILADRRTPIGGTHLLYDALRALAAVDEARLGLLFGAGLGLYANRLDALYTARAAERLRLLRNDNLLGTGPDGFVRGVQVGAFGWVGAIPRARAGRNAGHILAPSVPHAIAAGVLLSADHARRIDSPGGPRADDYAVELSSRRTRTARALLDGLREGQAMPALLGYRIERALIQAGGTAPALIARLRGIASTAARPIGPGGAALPETAAEAVCDGLALVRLATAELAEAPDLGRLGSALQQPRALDPVQERVLREALAQARDAIDATADVLLAESVYQLANGNPDRAAGATDILSGAVPPPDRLDVLQPPERGIAVNHRLLLALDPDRPPRAGWPAGSPRGLADPDLESWLGHLLPAPDRILVRLLDADGGDTGKRFSLRELLDALPQDDPPLGPLDLAYAGAEPARIERGPLEDRLRAAGERLTGDPAVRFDWTRDPAWDPEISALDEAAGVAAAARALLGHARALQADDLPGAVVVDAADLDARLDATGKVAEAALKALDAARTDPDARPRARRWAGAFGLPVGADTTAGWQETRDTLQQRIDAATTGRPPRERLAALFDAQPVLPRFTGVDPDWIKRFHGALGVPATALRAFAARAARVRPGVAAMAALETRAQRGEDTAGLHGLAVSQTPYQAGDRWVGDPGTPPRGRTAFVAWRRRDGRALQDAGDPVCGLLLDRWSELVPAAETDAAIAFHVDAPSTAAPNAILLCVPETGMETWSESGVLAHVLEAFELAKLRTVQPQALGGLAQFASLALVDDGRHQPSFGQLASEGPAP